MFEEDRKIMVSEEYVIYPPGCVEQMELTRKIVFIPEEKGRQS